MPDISKYDLILDALQELLKDKNIQSVSVSEIAQTAGIGKGSIYYYFPSKDAILEALIERNYKKPLETAKNLAKQTDIAPFIRMAMIFSACRNASAEFIHQNTTHNITEPHEQAYMYYKYVTYLIQELKPQLAEIIRQGIEMGEIHFDNPDGLADIVLLVLTAKFSNTLSPSDPDDAHDTLSALVSLLEKGTEVPAGSLNYLLS